MRKKKVSMSQLEVILNRFDLNSRQVLPEIAFKEEPDLKHQWIEKLSIKVKPKDEVIKIKISGLYCQEYASSYKSGGLWQPSSPSKEEFEYEIELEN